MKKYLVPFIVSLLLCSCTEDVSKDISTDLAQESEQFFKFSEAISESSYLGNFSYSEYLTFSSAELPGCPKIIQIPESRIIELIYATDPECEQTKKSLRTGKIRLDFTLSESETPYWSLTYENYTFEGRHLEGSRQFVALNANENRENFEDVTVELENQLSFVATGTFTFSVVRSGSKPFSLSTQGRIEGRNPAGRNFSIFITSAKEQSFQCYQDGWELPQKGAESWIVSRSNSTTLDYDVSFQKSDVCEPFVISTLPDGRTLQLNP